MGAGAKENSDDTIRLAIITFLSGVLITILFKLPTSFTFLGLTVGTELIRQAISLGVIGSIICATLFAIKYTSKKKKFRAKVEQVVDTCYKYTLYALVVLLLFNLYLIVSVYLSVKLLSLSQQTWAQTIFLFLVLITLYAIGRLDKILNK